MANLSMAPGSAINTVERIVSAFSPPTKRPGTTAAKVGATGSLATAEKKKTGAVSV